MPNEANGPNMEMLLGQLAQLDNFSLNVGQNYIVITKDKLHIHLIKTQKNLERRSGWATPLGIFVSLLFGRATANFKDFIFPASTWKTVSIIGAAVALIWLVISVVRHVRAETIEQIIQRIKTDPR
jgi:hypothetical protein